MLREDGVVLWIGDGIGVSFSESKGAKRGIKLSFSQIRHSDSMMVGLRIGGGRLHPSLFEH